MAITIATIKKTPRIDRYGIAEAGDDITFEEKLGKGGGDEVK